MIRNNIALYRKKLKLNQKKFSLLCGWADDQSRISNYERGRRSPSIDDCIIMVDAIVQSGVECSLNDLFSIIDEHRETKTMTDRFNRLTVVLAKDMRDDDAEHLLNAIRCLRGVISVDGNVVDPIAYMAQARVTIDLKSKLWDLLNDVPS